MPTPNAAPALMVVTSAILHPIAAAAEQYVVWYPARGFNVLRQKRGTWSVVRSLPNDDDGALAALLLDGTLKPFSDDDVALLQPLLSAPRRAAEQPPAVAADATERPLRHHLRLV